MALLFEDTFKKMLFDLKKTIDTLLPKYVNKRDPLDVITIIRSDTITNGLEGSISSGNWNLKRFKMERFQVT